MQLLVLTLRRQAACPQEAPGIGEPWTGREVRGNVQPARGHPWRPGGQGSASASIPLHWQPLSGCPEKEVAVLILG